MKELERVRWRCRRGMLELDIVLGRFVERYYEELDAAGREAFDALLDMPDAELWDIITSGENVPPAASQAAVLKLIRAA